jgi:hypothetical protein
MDETTAGTGTRVAPEINRVLSRGGALLLLLVIAGNGYIPRSLLRIR